MNKENICFNTECINYEDNKSSHCSVFVFMCLCPNWVNENPIDLAKELEKPIKE